MPSTLADERAEQTRLNRSRSAIRNGVKRTGPIPLGILRMVTDSPTPVSLETIFDAFIKLVPPGRAHRQASRDIAGQRTSSRNKHSRNQPRRVDLEADHDYLVWQGKRRVVQRHINHLVYKRYIQRVRFDGADSLELGERPFPWELLSTGDEDEGRDAPAPAD